MIMNEIRSKRILNGETNEQIFNDSTPWLAFQYLTSEDCHLYPCQVGLVKIQELSLIQIPVWGTNTVTVPTKVNFKWNKELQLKKNNK